LRQILCWNNIFWDDYSKPYIIDRCVNQMLIGFIIFKRHL
jgi:hypothetical protein